VPNAVFFWKMHKVNSLQPFVFSYFPGFFLFAGKPRLLWLGVLNGRPAVAGERLFVMYKGKRYELTFDNHDTALKAILYVFTWLLALLAQLLFVLSFVTWTVLSLVYTAPVLLFGIFLFQTKVISVGTGKRNSSSFHM